MWAQLITMHVKPGHDADVAKLVGELDATEQPDSGLLRSTTMVDQKDPTRIFTLVVFESEEQARVREQDPRRQEGLERVRAILADIAAGPPEFVDLRVIDDRAR